MAYIFYTLTFLTLLFGTLLYFTRAHWMPAVQDAVSRIDLTYLPRQMPGSEYIYSQLPSSFAGDIEAGLSSSTFDLNGNVEEGDSRAGLDDNAKREILTIMKKRRVRFDEARRIYMEQRFSANGIGADGRPKDPKFVSFS
ncbi:hypothetical protein QBC46DRAFT_374947 [Diplogelasinospora grovesii]|uniref:Uncharacterized protein n=1 Tax=Diplogelasinospora grovesii TaxID=303347 RepID=A0AAN6NEJ2_9PEZI|nr:hypothetical protein QBC46DRAFT_374947 [Diplogelasinospora grovesii]